MTRTTLYKAHYFAVLGLAGLIAALALVHYQFSLVSVVVVLVLLILPGRILGFYWRNLLRGLRLLNARRYEESRLHSVLFLEELRQRPYLRHLVWLGSSTYSHNPEVLALNNLGAAESKLGQLDSARQHLERAIELDPQCPLPFLNLGIIHASNEEFDAAERCFSEATRLGYANDLSDRIVRASQDRFARTGGGGTS